MQPLRRLSVIEQTAAHLREGLRSGRWVGRLPGVVRLAGECDVSPVTLRAALKLLEDEGVLEDDGFNGRVILGARKGAQVKRVLRVAILLHTPLIDDNAGMQRVILQLQHDLEASGHVCLFPKKAQSDLNHEVRRIARLVGETKADVWVVVAATMEVLQWFAAQPVPVIALGGRSSSVPIASAGRGSAPTYGDTVRHLAALGHRQIVLLGPRAWRMPTPSLQAKAFAAALGEAGIVAGEYNFPDWDETKEGLQNLLHSLFRVTPPTALVVMHTNWLVGVLAFLSERGLRVPAQVSLVCTSLDESLAWHTPALAHFRLNEAPLIRRIVRWVGDVARGRGDRECITYATELEPCGSIAPPPK